MAIAGVVVGLIEGLVATGGVFQAAVASGYFLWFFGSLTLLVTLAARLLWRAWQVPALVERHRGDTGGVPVVAGWLAYALIALTGLYQIVFYALQAIMKATKAAPVIVLSITLITAAAALLLILLSRPGAIGLTWIIRVIDRRIHARFGRSAFTPAAIAWVTAAGVIALGVAAWTLSIKPSIGHFDIAFAPYLAGFVVTVIAVHRVWPGSPGAGEHPGVQPRARRLTAVALAAAILASASALGARHGYPDAMLDTWGRTQLAGLAIDQFHNIANVRQDLELVSAKPRIQPEYEDPASRPDVIVIMVDTVRADRTPMYNGPSAMPNILRLAHESAVFERAFSPSNNTRRSLPAMLLGASPGRISGRVVGWSLALDPRHVTLAERMRAGGHETAGFFCCGSFYDPANKTGWNLGFDHVALHDQDRVLAEAGRAWIAERDARNPEAPLFAWFHFLEPHNWRVTHRATATSKTLHKRYDRSLKALDQALSALLAMLESRTRADRTIIVFTSDHGEGLGDRGQAHHSSNLHDSQIRVPLLISGPEIPARRIADTVGLGDLAPTLLDLAGYVPPGMPAMDTTSFAPRLRDEPPPGHDSAPDASESVPESRDPSRSTDSLGPGRAYSIMVADRSVPRSAWAIIAGHHKYIERGEDGPAQLYDLEKDPRENHDIAEQEPEILARMRAIMAERRAIDRVVPF